MGEIVQSLFGPSPDEIRMQQMQAMDAQSRAFAQMTPQERATYGISQGAGMLGGQLAESMGMVNPAMQQAQQRQQAMSGGNVGSSAGLRAAAERMRQMGDLQRSYMLIQLADKKDAEDADLEYKRAQAKALGLPRSEGSLPSPMQQAMSIADLDHERGTDGWKNAYRKEYTRLTTKESGDGIKKPKGLSREASLKWDLDNGFIDQETYDLAMRGTAGGKVASGEVLTKEKEDAGIKWLNAKYSAIENTMADSLGIPLEQLQQALSPQGKESSAKTLERAVGSWDAMVPKIGQSQVKVNILSHIERLKQLGETGGLAELKAAGVAPGSITVTEWPKFRADLANIDENLSGKELVKQYMRIIQKIQDSRIGVADYVNKLPENGGLPKDSDPYEYRTLPNGKVQRRLK